MKITFTPQSGFVDLALSVAGAVLTINGAAVHLASYDADTAPHDLIVGRPGLIDGDWHVTMIRPYRGRAAPEVITITAGDGPVTIPI